MKAFSSCSPLFCRSQQASHRTMHPPQEDVDMCPLEKMWSRSSLDEKDDSHPPIVMHHQVHIPQEVLLLSTLLTHCLSSCTILSHGHQYYIVPSSKISVAEVGQPQHRVLVGLLSLSCPAVVLLQMLPPRQTIPRRSSCTHDGDGVMSHKSA